MEGKSLLTIALFEQSLTRDFRFGASEALRFTVKPAMKRFVNFDRERFHKSRVIRIWQKCNTELWALGLRSSAFGQSPPGKPIIELVQEHGHDNDTSDDDLAVILVNPEYHDAAANHLDNQRP